VIAIDFERSAKIGQKAINRKSTDLVFGDEFDVEFFQGVPDRQFDASWPHEFVKTFSGAKPATFGGFSQGSTKLPPTAFASKNSGAVFSPPHMAAFYGAKATSGSRSNLTALHIEFPIALLAGECDTSPSGIISTFTRAVERTFNVGCKAIVLVAALLASEPSAADICGVQAIHRAVLGFVCPVANYLVSLSAVLANQCDLTRGVRAFPRAVLPPPICLRRQTLKLLAAELANQSNALTAEALTAAKVLGGVMGVICMFAIRAIFDVGLRTLLT
jgi:hypothetical protein